ncbi:F-type H+-transporting ATPase subunit b [Sphingomonas vulcanisoli]|uniref:ATP synthase subunit b n=1 Tax=Sphingomonas vulcanisoli TaxID=1658060 RepID=A0ABX0TNL4_9SPHN|nr:F0F1 ATP synthase subunit B [Sphingomonas vulcanisoli]NIJ07026.1 F-type H+-transporting ATPase subunit b [Sphingomonas vulcanisoli]
MAHVTGTQLNATTVAQPEKIEHAEMTALGLPPGGWVALSMIVVLAIVIWKKVPAAIGAALDRQIAAIRTQLDEASKLRADAEALKAEYETKARQADADAQSILDHAQAEAALIVAKAKEDAETLVARRGRMAEDKIAAAERAAIAELRAKAATAAAAAAATLIAETHDAGSDKAMVDKTITGLGQRLN